MVGKATSLWKLSRFPRTHYMTFYYVPSYHLWTDDTMTSHLPCTLIIVTGHSEKIQRWVSSSQHFTTIVWCIRLGSEKQIPIKDSSGRVPHQSWSILEYQHNSINNCYHVAPPTKDVAWMTILCQVRKCINSHYILSWLSLLSQIVELN